MVVWVGPDGPRWARLWMKHGCPPETYFFFIKMVDCVILVFLLTHAEILDSSTKTDEKWPRFGTRAQTWLNRLHVNQVVLICVDDFEVRSFPMPPPANDQFMTISTASFLFFTIWNSCAVGAPSHVRSRQHIYIYLYLSMYLSYICMYIR